MPAPAPTTEVSATTGDGGATGMGRANTAAPATSSASAALPVQLALGGPVAEEVEAWVEGALGWQVSDPAAHDPVPPVLVLRDGLAAPVLNAPGVDTDLPTLLVVPDAAPPAAAATAAQQLRPAAVVGWPSQREELPELAAALLSQPRHRTSGPTMLSVGGSAGGVGTTTVALALAGLRAWDGSHTLAAVRGFGLPWRSVPTAALGGGELWAAADQLPGFDGRLRAVRLVDREDTPSLSDPAISAVVVDAGPEPDCDLLVCRADAAGLAALEVTPAAAVVLVGAGAVRRSTITAALAGRRCIELPFSARVARAGLHGRLPAGLPGAWVARLAPLLGDRTRPPG